MMCHHEMYLHKATRISAPHDVRPKKWMVQYTDLAYPEFTHPANTHPALCTTWLARSKGKKKILVKHCKWSQMVPNGSYMIQNGPKWAQMVPIGSQMVPNGPKWTQTGPKWSPMVPDCLNVLCPNCPIWFQKVPNGPKWSQMVPNISK